MKAFSQPLSGLIRVGPYADEYGKPWTYLVAYTWVDHATCMLWGLKADGGFEMAHGRAIAREARRLGFSRLQWERQKGRDSYGIGVDLDPDGRERHQHKHHSEHGGAGFAYGLDGAPA